MTGTHEHNQHSSEAQYRLLLENAPIGIIAIDSHGDITEINPAALKILSPAVAKTNIFSFSPLIEAGLTLVIQRCLKSAEPILSEHAYTDPTGKQSYLQLQVTPMPQVDDQNMGVQIIVENISKRQQSELTLQQLHTELDIQAKKRTAELSAANERLKAEIVERQRAEESLQRVRIQLEIRVAERTAELEQVNKKLSALALENTCLLAEARQWANQLETLGQASLSLTASFDLPQVLQAILKTTLELVVASDAHIFLYADDKLTFGAALWDDGRTDTPFVTPRPDGFTHITARQAEVIIVPDIRKHPLFATAFPDWKGAIVGFPLKIGQQVVGVMNIARLDPGPFLETELRVLHLLADQAAIAIDNANLYEQAQQEIVERKQTEKKLQQTLQQVKQSEETLRQRIAELASLNHIAQTVATITDMQAAWNFVAKTTNRIFNGHGSILTLLNADQTVLTIFAHHIRPASPSTPEKKVKREQNLFGLTLPLAHHPDVAQIVKAGQSVVISQAQTHPQLQSIRKIMQGQGIYGLMNVPLRTQGKIVGFITIASAEIDREFTPTEVTLVETIASHLAGAVEITRLFDEAQQAKEVAENAQKEAEQANRSKSKFLANMSHELRTPLNGILGYTQILQQDKNLTISQREAISTIQQSGEHLLTLLNDILDLSKIEAGKMELRTAQFHLPRFLKNIVDIFQIRAKQKGIVFIYERFPNLPVGVQGDEKRLRQVLINLLGNAVKFTKQGKVTFKILMVAEQSPLTLASSSVVAAKGQRTKIRFQVQDTGIGISLSDLEKVFLPFQQVGNLMDKEEGTGLGLPISQRLVEMMGSELRISSSLDVGTVFWFDLDLPTAEGWIDKTKVEEALIVGFKGPKHKILIVDDDTKNRMMLLDLLSPLGFELLEASNGQDALDKAKTFQPDLILMDLVMPVMDGFEATRRIRIREAGARQMGQTALTQNQAAIIIAVSASAFDEDRQKSLETGYNDFVAKPIQFRTLLQKIETFLNLEWVYAEELGGQKPEPEQSKVPPLLIGPPPQEAVMLYTLALRGDIKRIKTHLPHLEQLDDKYQPFVAELRRLTKTYRIEQIQKLLKLYVEDKPHE